jgi:hypothetical protein
MRPYVHDMALKSKVNIQISYETLPVATIIAVCTRITQLYDAPYMSRMNARGLYRCCAASRKVIAVQEEVNTRLPLYRSYSVSGTEDVIKLCINHRKLK